MQLPQLYPGCAGPVHHHQGRIHSRPAKWVSPFLSDLMPSADSQTPSADLTPSTEPATPDPPSSSPVITMRRSVSHLPSPLPGLVQADLQAPPTAPSPPSAPARPSSTLPAHPSLRSRVPTSALMSSRTLLTVSTSVSHSCLCIPVTYDADKIDTTAYTAYQQIIGFVQKVGLN